MGTLSRRTVLLGAVAGLGTAATVGLRHPAAAMAAPVGAPATMARVLVSGGRRSTDFPLTHLAVAWPSGPGPAPRVRFRSADREQAWQVVTGCPAGRDGAGSALDGGLLRADGATGYDVDYPAGAVRLGEINVLDGPRRPAPTRHESFTLGGRTMNLDYRGRAEWGADEGLRFAEDGTELFPAEYFPVQTLTVHHTATPPSQDPAATVRAIYYDHTVVREFGDIGYHLLIDDQGVVYEGRWSGADGTPVFGGRPGPDGRPQMSNAAHVAGFNAGNVGIALLGDFTEAPPTDAAVESLVRVLRVLAGVSRLEPGGTTSYVNPVSGATATVRTICGHQDWRATECPGDRLYPKLAAVRQAVATVPALTPLDPGGPGPT